MFHISQGRFCGCIFLEVDVTFVIQKTCLNISNSALCNSAAAFFGSPPLVSGWFQSIPWNYAIPLDFAMPAVSRLAG